MYCICWRSLKFGRGLKRRPWDSNSLHKFTIQPFVNAVPHTTPVRYEGRCALSGHKPRSTSRTCNVRASSCGCLAPMPTRMPAPTRAAQVPSTTRSITARSAFRRRHPRARSSARTTSWRCASTRTRTRARATVSTRSTTRTPSSPTRARSSYMTSLASRACRSRT